LNFAILASTIPVNVTYQIDRAHSYLVNGIARYRDPDAWTFFNELIGDGYNPNAHIDVLVPQKLIYINIPKCASTSIKMILSSLVGRLEDLAAPARSKSIAESYRRCKIPRWS
jgi:hypothetical protein